LCGNNVLCIVRKRVPKTCTPTWLYVYINAPVSALIGRFRITAIEPLNSLSKDFLDRSRLTRQEAENYIRESTVSTYSVGPFEPGSSVITLREFRQRFDFAPPQSFLFLSTSAKRWLDSRLELADLPA
jgi:predicted transcriptional regulator